MGTRGKMSIKTSFGKTKIVAIRYGCFQGFLIMLKGIFLSKAALP